MNLMFGMSPTCEAIAHFIHGGVTVFFVTWTWLLWPLRKQNNMMYMLFINMLYLAFCNLKDLIFLVDGLWENTFLTGISVTIDLLYVPIFSNFFIEVVAPGWVNKRRVLVPMAVQALFVPLFILFPTDFVYDLAMSWAYGGGVLAMILVGFLARRHKKFIRDHYSYSEYIDVSWSIRSGFLLFICLTLYVVTFTYETWLSGAVYQSFCMLSWLYLYSISKMHQVVDIPPLTDLSFPLGRDEDLYEGAQTDSDTHQAELFEKIAELLDEHMINRKMYLNPKLSLQDVASEIGTNRTYLSSYLNHRLEKNFFEYVNALRIEEACRLMNVNPRKFQIQEISELSGFNSISSFNRAFVKYTGKTPGDYYRHIDENAH